MKRKWLEISKNVKNADKLIENSVDMPKTTYKKCIQNTIFSETPVFTSIHCLIFFGNPTPTNL